MKIDPARSILVPTAHDEPAIKLRHVPELFRLAEAIAYNTDVERRFLKSTFEIATAGGDVGCGVDLLQNRPRPARARRPSGGQRRRELARQRRGTAATCAARRALPPPPSAAGAGRLYGGRIDPGKGCEELLEYFNGKERAGGDATW